MTSWGSFADLRVVEVLDVAPLLELAAPHLFRAPRWTRLVTDGVAVGTDVRTFAIAPVDVARVGGVQLEQVPALAT